MKTVAVIGSGSFGCALSYVLSQNDCRIKIWSYKDDECDLINKEHKCKYLDNFKLDEKIKCFRDYESVIKGSDFIILVTPSNTIRKTCKEIKNYITNQEIIIASKGLEGEKLLTDVVKEELNKDASLILGPSHAEQVVKDVPTFVEYYGNKEIKKIFETDKFKLFYNEDKIGMEIGASLKNVISIYTGIVDELGYDTNTISYVLTEGLREIKEIGLKLGAKEKTFYGLSGMGDLITTSLSLDSRNKRAGIMIAKGKSIDEVKETLETVEGIDALNYAYKIINEYKIDCPLILSLYDVIYNKKNINLILD